MDEYEYCIDPVDIPFKNATHSDTVVDISTSLGPGEYGRCQGDCGKYRSKCTVSFIFAHGLAMSIGIAGSIDYYQSNVFPPYLHASLFFITKDEDIDCEGELVCFFPNDAIRIVPGCIGRPSSGWEYCADPKDVEDHAKRFGVDVTQVKSAPSDAP